MPIGIIETILVAAWVIRYLRRRKGDRCRREELKHLKPLFEMMKRDFKEKHII